MRALDLAPDDPYLGALLFPLCAVDICDTLAAIEAGGSCVIHNSVNSPKCRRQVTDFT